MADLGAAFGFYPQLNRRRQGSPADSANLPIDVLRGRLAGLLGAPADIANLLRSPSPTEMFGDISYEAPAQFPYTTEKFLKDLPLAPTSRVGQLAGQAASFVPLNPMPAVRGVQKVGQVVGEELAATMLGQRPNSMMSKVVPQPLFAVAPEQGLLSVKTEPIESLLQVKPQAPVSDIGFYSATEQAALNLGRNKGTGQSFINDIMKAPDVKKEELAYTGLDDFLRDKPNVTKQEVQDFLANNRVDVQEVTYGAPIAEDPIGIAKRKEVFDKYEPEIQDLYRRIDKPEYVVYDAETNTVLKNYTNYDDALLDNLDPMGAFSKARTGLRPKENSRQLQQQITDLQNLRDAQADAVYKIPESTPTKFGKYTLAGGENYREILLTLPRAKSEVFTEIQQKIKRLEAMKEIQAEFAAAGNIERANSFATKANALEESIKELKRTPIPKPREDYQSSHFNEPNILAHMRVNDRIDADGKKMLLVEEIQSDWHQAGRERGYRKQGDKQALEAESKAIGDERNRLVKELSEQEKQNGFVSIEGQQQWDAFKEKENLFKQKYKDFSSQAPDAPFKDTWYQLALKRLTKYAAENGYERIGLTTGKQQADRFNLAESFDAMNYKKNKDGTYAIAVKPKGEGIFQSDFGGTTLSNIPEKELPSIVGKELAQKIISGEGRQAASRKVLEGIDLQVGGEGMKKYYDEIYPKFLDKYGKKYGASVGETKIKTDNVPYVDYVVKQGYFNDHTVFGVEPNGTTTVINQNAANMAEAQALANRYKEKNLGGGETIRYLDVTPKMKEGTSKGQPLFAATPLLPATSLLDEEKRKEITSLLE